MPALPKRCESIYINYGSGKIYIYNIKAFTLRQVHLDEKKIDYMRSVSYRSTTWLQLSRINPKLLRWSTFIALIQLKTGSLNYAVSLFRLIFHTNMAQRKNGIFIRRITLNKHDSSSRFCTNHSHQVLRKPSICN